MILVSLAQQDSEFAALVCGFTLIAAHQPEVDRQPANLQHKELLLPPKIDEPKKLPTIFADIAVEFSKWVAKDEVTVLVSGLHPMQLNPLLKSRESLLAMLILAFPEARWFFGSIRGYGESEEDAGTNALLDDFRLEHGLFNLFQPHQTVLFDGVGLRDWVRKCAKKDSETEKDAHYIPRREQLAVAMDEETDYAHLHAYTAYRFGFRALAISNRAAADAVLGSDAKLNAMWGTPDVVLEDLFLNFPDGGDGLSNLQENRKEAFPVLDEEVSPQKNRHRILVTSGQRLTGDTDKNARNRHLNPAIRK
uniref:Uncharacterized protein n=1 Tax=Candidatus Kentrum sp. FM TaxID=2126340 RepID=A0A450SD74_9GAMM|nr:MAG: hypothetical protein BECKFM1743A_GA0114220_100841 [Candidatus Kentron sp. FM]VFJ51153.1 MAG: hypothetical protein BECKFM1743C_GA0114222_100941 [Candidatus Kentron sp. FM]VFK08841.1 MAG: hypothetical protein BECKFM1743B_GA0114221_100831 [Candidatus Kentron sp. FM]